MVKVIVGLGNPGQKYELTRHNLGCLVVKGFAAQEGWTFKEEKRFSTYVAEGKIGDCKIALLLPTTYMNLSGKAVQSYLAYYGLSPQNLIVVTDDVYVEYGLMRFRTEGSAGGHNGLKNIEACLATQNYPRLRMGVGLGPVGMPREEYVLNVFSKEELAQLPPLLERAASALKIIALAVDPKEALGSVNSKKDSVKGSGEQKA